MDIEELKRLAEAATPGQWRTDKEFVCPARQEKETIYVESWNPVAEVRKGKEDAAYIAAANPAAMLKLIAEVERLRTELSASQAREKVRNEALEKLLSWIDAWCDTGPETNFEAVERLADAALTLPADDTALRAVLAQRERETIERCAKVCEKGIGSHPACSMWDQGYDSACRARAAAIRALEVKP